MYQLDVKLTVKQVKQELGYTEKTIPDAQIDKLISELIEKADPLLQPQGNYVLLKEFQISNQQIELTSAEFDFSSQDVAELLTNQQQVAILVATIGQKLEAKVAALFDQEKLTKATILDAIGSVAAEATANQLTTLIRQQAEKLGLPYLTMRFSPGYGDLSLEVQPKLLELVNGQKLGITANDSYLLSPQKSITALLGIGNQPGPKPGCDFDCQNCEYEECIYS